MLHWHICVLIAIVIDRIAEAMYCSGNAVAYSTTYSILAVAAFNDQNDKFNNGYNLKNHGSVFLYTRQNTFAPASTTATHNQFVFATKLQAADNSYVEFQRNCFGNASQFHTIVPL